MLATRLATVVLGALLCSVHAATKNAGWAYLAKNGGGGGKTFLSIDTAAYDLLTAPPRNYSLIVVYTAVDAAMGCEPCRLFQPAFEATAASYAAKYSSSAAAADQSLFFAVLDFANGKEVFHRLQMDSAPTVLHFPPTDGPRGKGIHAQPEKYIIQDFEADALAAWASSVSGIHFTIRKPFDYYRLATFVFFTLALLAAAKVLYSKLHFVWANPLLWAVMSLVFIVNMCSGYMYNQIRGTPYAGYRNGRAEIIAPGFGEQFGIETQIIALLYAVLSSLLVIMVQRVPSIPSINTQKIIMYGAITAFLVIYNALMNIFRTKNGGYPYKILPFL